MKDPSVVLLHPFPLDKTAWQPQAQALAGEFRIIVPDLRGFGSAYHRAAGIDDIPIKLAADDVLELLDAEGIERAVVGGISRGGYIAMAFARYYPERLRALMLFDTKAEPESDEGKATWEKVTERLRSGGISILPNVMRDRLWGKTAKKEQPELIRRIDQVILAQKPDAVAAAARGMGTREDSRPGLAKVQVPTLCVAGEEDGNFENVKAIATAVPGAQFVAIPNTGHLSTLERPHEVTSILREFLTKLS